MNLIKKRLLKLIKERDDIEESVIYNDAFEWRFEFPEVLDDQGSFIGFDVVIGNPPYIRQEELSPIKPYLSNHYTTFTGTADLYVYFIELGMRLLNNNKNFTFIVPNKWMRAGYGEKLRQFTKGFQIHELLDFGDLPVFEEATTYPLIISLQKSEPVAEFSAVNFTTLEFEPSMTTYVGTNKINVLTGELADRGWTLTDSKVQKLLAKLRDRGMPLGQYVEDKIYYGIKTGFNEAFVIDEDTKQKLINEDPASAEVIKPFLAGRDIKQYRKPEIKNYLILFKSGDTKNWFGDLSESDALSKIVDKYPAIMRWLSQYEEKAKARYDKGQYWWELRACDYYDEFEKEKIMLPDISLKAECLMDRSGAYCVNTAYIIPFRSQFLLGLLNSKLVLFFYSNLTSTIRGGYYRFIRQYLEQIPIAEPTNDITKFESLVDQIIKEKEKNPTADTSSLEEEIDQLVYKRYNLTEEEIAIVEKAVK